ncbi:ATP-binding protein [Rhodobacteraceae bacterium WD3A24]|nr:ATP-binding protein [Rhodobacteraceae bacterium WD3A24]
MTGIAELHHPKAGAPSARHVYCHADGTAVLVACRFEKGAGDKFFIPYDLVANDWRAPDTRPLYRLDEVAGADAARLVIVTEGEKCADALAGLGYVATTTFGGANGWRKAELAPLDGRNVILWPDKDEPGQKYAEGLAATLHERFGALPRIIPTSDLALRSIRAANDDAPAPYPKGWDAADAVAEGWGVREINTLIELAQPYPSDPPPAPDGAAAEEDTTPLLDALELWHTPDKTAYATFRLGGRWQTMEIGKAPFRHLLAYERFTTTGKTPSGAKLDDTLRRMSGKARFEGPERPVFTRLGTYGDAIVLDLGGADHAAVRITPEGWQVVQAKEPRFRRPPALASLPEPIRAGADINLLRDFVNAGSEADFRLMVGWLLGTLHRRGPYPLLVLSGEQGSAKSTTSTVLRSLVDPSTLAVRSFPGDERDLVIAAQGAHVLAFDNLSRIKPSMADALCRMATGGGFATRKLHSDADEAIFDAVRPCILNGIPDLAERADLADRAIALTLPSIAEDARAYEDDFWARFDAARPRILAALLDAASAALANRDSVTLPRRPRMADFARWVTAAEPALGWPPGAFLDAYTANKREAEDTALDASAAATAILTLIREDGEWSGTATELMTTLRRRFPTLSDPADGFPRKVNGFGAELRRIAPLLARRGVTVDHRRDGHDRARVIMLSG